MTLAYGMICYAMPNIDSNVSLLFLIFLFSVLDAPFSELLFCRAIEYRGKQIRLNVSLLFLIFLFSVLDAPFSELLFCRAIEYRGKQIRLYLSGTNAQQIFGSYSMHLEI